MDAIISGLKCKLFVVPRHEALGWVALDEEGEWFVVGTNSECISGRLWPNRLSAEYELVGFLDPWAEPVEEEV